MKRLGLFWKALGLLFLCLHQPQSVCQCNMFQNIIYFPCTVCPSFEPQFASRFQFELKRKLWWFLISFLKLFIISGESVHLCISLNISGENWNWSADKQGVEKFVYIFEILWYLYHRFLTFFSALNNPAAFLPFATVALIFLALLLFKQKLTDINIGKGSQLFCLYMLKFLSVGG